MCAIQRLSSPRRVGCCDQNPGGILSTSDGTRDDEHSRCGGLFPAPAATIGQADICIFYQPVAVSEALPVSALGQQLGLLEEIGRGLGTCTGILRASGVFMEFPDYD